MTTKSDATRSIASNKGETNNGSGNDAGRQNGSAVTSRFLQYLPSIFQKSNNGRRPEELWVNDFLPWLASWVALTLDEEWDEEKRRRLIGEAVELYRWRGTALGLKRYLEIYTGLDPQAITIVDGYQPDGMQIGVASRIGQAITLSSAQSTTVQPPVATAAEASVRKQDAYYIVDTVTPTEVLPGTDLPDLPDASPLQLYYTVDPTAGYHVERVQLEEDGVRLWVHLAQQADEGRTADSAQTEPTVKEYFHRRPPNMTKANIRRSSATDYGYFLEQRQDNGDLITRTYYGGSFLVEQMEAPYHFIIDLRESPTESAAEIDLLWQRLTKIQAILDRERPAHTVYHLNIRPTAKLATHQWMQIEVRSTIGLDSTIG